MAVLENAPAAGEMKLEVGPSFLPEDAFRIHQVLQGLDPGTRVAIDFRRVRDCHDFALSLLARDILGGTMSIALRGMSQHQERVLAYFGVQSAGAAEA
jgi:hypothetical protein